MNKKSDAKIKEKRDKIDMWNLLIKSPKLRFVIIFILVLVVYGVYMLVCSFMINKERTSVVYGKIELMENVQGYVFRDETVVEASENKSIKPIIKDGERTSKGEEVATYYESNYDDYAAQIKALDQQINSAMENKPDVFSNDAKILDDQILELVMKSQTSTSIDDIQATKTKVNELTQKKAKIVGDLSPAGSHIKDLINQRSKLENQANNSMQKILASKAGIVSYYVDGLEDIFTVNKLNQYTVKELEDYINTTKKNNKNATGVRISDNFEAYILVPYDSDKAKDIEIGKRLYLRFSDKSVDAIPATIKGKKEDNDKTILIISLRNSLEHIMNSRNISFELVWWQYEGMKVPKQAVYEENNEKYIDVNRYGETRKVQIKILKENNDFCIIDNYTYDEWIEKGLSSSDASNKSQVMLYDELVVNKK